MFMHTNCSGNSGNIPRLLGLVVISNLQKSLLIKVDNLQRFFKFVVIEAQVFCQL